MFKPINQLDNFGQLKMPESPPISGIENWTLFVHTVIVPTVTRKIAERKSEMVFPVLIAKIEVTKNRTVVQSRQKNEA